MATLLRRGICGQKQMETIWNESELKRPPMVTIQVSNAKFVEKLHTNITTCLSSHQSEHKEFAQTCALLSRVIARRKNSFRHFLGFRTLLKLNSTTCRLLRVDVQRELELFCGAIPDMVFGENALAELPTRNCLDFVLIRLLSAYQIRQRIHDLCLHAADYFAELLRANNYVDLNALVLAMLAKLRSLNVTLANDYINLYHKLLKKREQFPLGNYKCLIPSTFKLPAELTYFEICQIDNDEPEMESNVKLAPTVTIALKREIPAKFAKKSDLGTEVERKKKQTKSEKATSKFSIDQLMTVDDVKRFIASENKMRQQTPSSCISHRIPNHLWTGAQKILEKKVLAGDHKKALSVFRKFLSSNL